MHTVHPGDVSLRLSLGPMTMWFLSIQMPWGLMPHTTLTLLWHFRIPSSASEYNWTTAVPTVWLAICLRGKGLIAQDVVTPMYFLWKTSRPQDLLELLGDALVVCQLRQKMEDLRELKSWSRAVSARLLWFLSFSSAHLAVIVKDWLSKKLPEQLVLWPSHAIGD